MPKENGSEDRRRNKRMRLNCTVIYRLNEPVSTKFIMSGKDIQAEMVDISQHGMAVITDYDIPVSTRLSMRFTVLKVDKEIVNFSGPVEISGEVKSNTRQDGHHRLGIFFTKMRKVDTSQFC
ncbi:MAG: PilZ domain-containing protein [Deltaproteobacteria bacterium]